MDRTAGNESHCRAIPHSPTRRRSRGSILTLLCAACVVLFASQASAQCSARDVLKNRLTLKATAPADAPSIVLKSAFAVPVWRRIAIGTFANSFALVNALDIAGCVIGSSAEEILARPAFTVGTSKTTVELFAVSAAELGFESATAPLADIYTRARQLGFALAAAEVAPQLRLQYFDQPLGELLIAMEPIKTWGGEPLILAVANGGAGLALIGRDGSADAEIPVASRFVFMRPTALATAGHDGR
jgi:hypothetical protein